MKYTIEDLRQGKCAVINDGTLDELTQVLNKAFPYDKYSIDRFAMYYFLNIPYDGEWECGKETHLPTQSVKDFLEGKKQFPYKAMWGLFEVEVYAINKEDGVAWIKDQSRWKTADLDEIHPLPEKPYSFGEFALSEERGLVGPDDAVYRRLTDLYNKYQDYLKQFNQ